MRFQAKFDELRKALQKERFFDLGDSYGELAVDSGTTTIQVTAGDFTKTIELHSLVNWIPTEPARLREPSRAVRVLEIIRAWFNAPEAVDSRKYDQMVIGATGRK